MRYQIISSIAVGLMLAAPAIAIAADEEESSGPPRLIHIDKDHDNFLTPEEFKAATAAGVVIPFEKLDRAPKDGKISKKEYSVLLDEECE